MVDSLYQYYVVLFPLSEIYDIYDVSVVGFTPVVN
jgi:hypothetical protein